MQVSANSVLMLVSAILYSGSNHLKQCGNLMNINPHVGVMPMTDQGRVKAPPYVAAANSLFGYHTVC